MRVRAPVCCSPGAYVRDAQGKETRLRCREFDEKDEGLTIIVSRT